MKTKIILYLIIAALAAVVIRQATHAHKLKEEYERQKFNSEVLLSAYQKKYIAKDSLNALQVEALNLELSEYKKFRAADMDIINTLQVKNRDLQNITKAYAETKAELSGQIHDSIIYIDKVRVDTLRTINIKDAWLTLHGEITKRGEFSGTIINKDTIFAVISVKHKRALGFLWKTKKIKDTHADLICKNPHTQITQAECVVIQK